MPPGSGLGFLYMFAHPGDDRQVLKGCFPTDEGYSRDDLAPSRVRLKSSSSAFDFRVLLNASRCWYFAPGSTLAGPGTCSAGQRGLCTVVIVSFPGMNACTAKPRELSVKSPFQEAVGRSSRFHSDRVCGRCRLTSAARCFRCASLAKNESRSSYRGLTACKSAVPLSFSSGHLQRRTA